MYIIWRILYAAYMILYYIKNYKGQCTGYKLCDDIIISIGIIYAA